MSDVPPDSPDTGTAGEPSAEAEEPVVRGTLFIMLLFLMALVGFWILMYLRLLEV
jgi:hypothetical protein